MSIAAQRVEVLKRCGRMEAIEGTAEWKTQQGDISKNGRPMEWRPIEWEKK